MTLRQIAARNVWQNRRRYFAYIASAAFSVMIYFMYTALVYHPDLQSGYPHADDVVTGMKAASVVIAIFAFLFLLYSNGAFVRSRKKEFGMLSLLGLNRGQLVRMILWESLVVGGVALLTGLGVGLLFLKLFFMAISALLQLPEALPFYIGAQAWWQTLAVFGSFFIVVSLLSLSSVLRSSVIQLLRAGRQPKATPTFSRWKTGLGLLLVVGGYIWASVPDGNTIVLGIIPVTAMVSVGTFLLMREASIALLQLLHRSKRFFYRTGPFLSVSQLTFKMQDNYRVLSAVAITVAVIITAMGTISSLYVVMADEAVASHPRSFQLLQEGPGWESQWNRVESVLDRHEVQTAPRRELVTRQAIFPNERDDWDEIIFLVPYSFYADLRREAGKTPLPLNGDQDMLLTISTPAVSLDSSQAWEQNLKLDGEIRSMTLRIDNQGHILNWSDSRYAVISDSLFEKAMQQASPDQLMAVAFWDTTKWKADKVAAAVKELRDLYPAPGSTNYTGPVESRFTATLEPYQSTITQYGLALFVGFFVSLVFFAAACSILYFRLFTEQEEDRRYFRRLQELGVSRRDLRRASLQQTGVIFFVPFLVGLVHSTFAMQALGTLLQRTVLYVGWVVALGYLVLYGIFFAVTYGAYWRALSVREDIRERLT